MLFFKFFLGLFRGFWTTVNFRDTRKVPSDTCGTLQFTTSLEVNHRIMEMEGTSPTHPCLLQEIFLEHLRHVPVKPLLQCQIFEMKG